MRKLLIAVLIAVVKDTSLKTVGGDRRTEAVSVEKPTILVGLSVETLDIRAVSVGAPIIQIEPKARIGLDREMTDGICRATRLLPTGSSEWLPAIHDQRV